MQKGMLTMEMTVIMGTLKGSMIAWLTQLVRTTKALLIATYNGTTPWQLRLITPCMIRGTTKLTRVRPLVTVIVSFVSKATKRTRMAWTRPACRFTSTVALLFKSSIANRLSNIRSNNSVSLTIGATSKTP